MRLPETADQVRTAPLRALRAVFAGIGQLLVAADRFREESGGQPAEDHYDAFREWDRPPAAVARGGADLTEEPGAAAPPATGDGPPKAAAAGGSDMAARRSAGKARGPATTTGAENTMRGGRTRRSREAAGPRRFRSLDSTGNVRVLTPEDMAELDPAELDPAEVARAGVARAVVAADQDTAPHGVREPPPLATGNLPIPAYDGLSLPSLRSRLRTLDAGQLRVLLDYERSNARRDDVMGMFERRITKLGATGSDAT